MKTRKILLSAAAILCCLLPSSCGREDFDTRGDGYPIQSITFKATAPMESAEISTKATDAVETNVESLAFVLIPAGTGSTAKVVKVTEFTISQQVSTTNYIYSASVDLSTSGLIGGQYYLYAIANYDKEFISVDIDALNGKTKDEIDQMVVTKGNHDRDIAETALLMSGKYGDTGLVHLSGKNSDAGTDGNNTLTETIHLKRLVSKITVTFDTADDVTFTPETYSIYNYSRCESLMERNGWDGSDPGSLTYFGSDASSAFASETRLPVKDEGIVFYMPENVQVPATKATWTYADRDTRSYTDDEPYGDFLYAPAEATYIVVKGAFKSNTYTGDVAYTIHLGDFSNANSTHTASGKGSYSNFTIRRNYKYNYYITINGVNNIIAECNATDESPNDPNPGADGDIVNLADAISVNLDAHYEQVLLSFKLADIIPFQYSLIAKTPYSNGTAVDNNGASSDDIAKLAVQSAWIRYGAPASTTTFNSYSEASTTDFYTLIAELKTVSSSDTEAPSGAHFIISGGRIYITAYVNEYFYDKVPGTTTDASLSDFVNADNRSLTIAFENAKVSKDMQSTYAERVVFSISQKSIKSVENLNSTNPFGMETTEETTPPTTYYADPGIGSSITDGWANFNETITAKGITYGTTAWDDVVTVATNGYIGSTYGTGILTTDYDTGYYQCLTRNRDEDGDGIIDQEEIKWYLPSYDQCATMYFGEGLLTSASMLYQSSWTDDDSKCYFTSTKGAWRIIWAKQGTTTSNYKNDSWFTALHGISSHVRCARSLNAYNTETTPVATYSGTSVTINGLDSRTLRTAYLRGEYAEHHNRGNDSSPDVLPTAYQVAASDLTITTKEEQTTGYETTATIMKFSDIDAMSVGDTKLVLIANPDIRTINGCFIGYNGSTIYYSSGTSYAAESNIADDAENVIDNSQYLFTLTKTSSTTYTIAINGYGPANNGSASTLTWSTSLVEYTLSNGTTGDKTNATPGLTDYYIRFATGSGTYLNSSTHNLMYASGLGEHSIWCLYNVETKPITEIVEVTKDTFNNTDLISGTDFCAKNYSQSDNDLGLWRIPNEKELYIMWRGKYFTGTNNYLSRTTFNTSVYGYNGTNGNITLDMAGQSYSVNTGHIRCVRDVKSTTPDSSYTNGGNGASF